MGHYAKIVDGKVVKVIVANEDFFKTFADTSPGRWVKTSYNTHGGKHSGGKAPLRGNFAGIGYSYDDKNDVFIPPKPSQGEWVLDTQTWLWKGKTK